MDMVYLIILWLKLLGYYNTELYSTETAYFSTKINTVKYIKVYKIKEQEDKGRERCKNNKQNYPKVQLTGSPKKHTLQ